jgi:RHS repeat-associated protein
MGRPLLETRINASQGNQTKLSVGYAYNLDGSPKTLTYPSGDVVTYTVGGAGRATQLSDASNNYVGYTGNTAKYTPNGSLASMTNGYTSTPPFAGIVTSNIYNDRLQPILLSAGVGQSSLSSLCYDFNLGVSVGAPCNIGAYTTGDNGNVFRVLNTIDGTRNATFAYDPLNRIQQANTVNTTSSNCWGEVYTIDAWGNLTNRAGVSGMTGCSTEPLNAAPATSQNQLPGISYDIAGNVLNDGNGNTPTYDAENRIATDAGVTYYYDADGVRMEKSSGTKYWPGPSGTLTEADLAGTINEEYIYFNGARIARVDRPSGTVHYYFSNHLGSHTMVTSATGSCEQDIDYYPYGGVITDHCPNVAQHYKFTGKERDSESGLDMFGARYYGSSLGRFMTPDWAAKPVSVPYASFGNPQSLNLYSYVNNNPTTTRDLDGHSDYLWQKFKNSLEGNGWKTDAQVKGLSVAQTAQSHVGSKDWAINGTNTSGKDVGHPQVFKPGSDKCNQFVGDTLAEAGKTRPEIKDKDGNTRMPSAHEMADPNVHIPGLSDTKPLSEAKPGDVIAQEHGDTYGHAGIVAGSGETVSANATGNYGGQITQNDWGFRPAGQNGESSTDPAPVVRHPEDQ